MTKKLRVLIVHNSYQHQGGEDMVAAAEIALLRSRGHIVETYFRHNDEITSSGAMSLAKEALWSRRTTQDITQLILEFRPEIVHIHNTFPLISPSVYWAVGKQSIPVIQTMHNFRLMCPQAMFLREQKVCEDCLGNLPWRGVLRACYRDSRLQSGVLAAVVTVHGAIGTWKNKVTRYIALNEFCRDKFIAGGLPAERIVIKPNFVDFTAPEPATRAGFLFVGRLSVEKGVSVMMNAIARLGDVDVRVAGVGPQSHLLTESAQVTTLGSLSSSDVQREMSQAMALILPSIWYENFPRTLVEAFGCGLPVIASRIGALGELIEHGVTGLLFNPGDASDLAEKMAWAQQHPEQMAEMGRNARAHYEAEFTADRNYEQLIQIYHDAISELTMERCQ